MYRLQSLLTPSILLLALSHLFAPAYAWPMNSTNVIPPQRSFANAIEKGYVAFGDSFAAGLGTGTTTTDSCRRGEFSYPKQLAKTAPEDIDFQNIACSGAKISDVLKASGQIDSWTNPSVSDIATISIGGNDIGFSKILNHCVLQPLGTIGQLFTYNCQARLNEAKAKLEGDVLRQNILQVLTKIVTKSDRGDFKVYYTGYPAFFNVDTTYCNDVTFWWASPHHRPLHINDGYPYLNQVFRRELNDLVQSLNTYISDTINQFNARPESPNNPQVVFVPTDAAFNGHRFCEDGVQEPSPQRQDTWFFLSGWADNQLPGSTTPFTIEDPVTEGNTTALPDFQTCDPDDDDPAMSLQCQIAIGVSKNATSDIATIFFEDQALIAKGDFSAVRMPWWLPTRQAKTFHPRTLGQLAFRDAVISHF